jgi:hypothetical protein
LDQKTANRRPDATAIGSTLKGFSARIFSPITVPPGDTVVAASLEPR